MKSLTEAYDQVHKEGMKVFGKPENNLYLKPRLNVVVMEEMTKDMMAIIKAHADKGKLNEMVPYIDAIIGQLNAIKKSAASRPSTVGTTVLQKEEGL